MEPIELKRGATLTIAGLYEEGGVAVDLTNYTITSQAYDSLGNLVTTFVVTKAASQSTTGKGKFTMTPNTSTVDWPIDELVADVKIVDGSGNVKPFPDFNIVVKERRTVV